MQEWLEGNALEELVAFAAVADAGSFTAAAKKLQRDASVISRRITHLETRLGARLLSRTTRRVALTEVGATYHRRVQSILDELANAGREASDSAASLQGLLRVSVPATFGRQWIAPLLPSFLSRHPLIRIDARFNDSVVDLLADGFDVAIRVGVLRDSSLTARKIASYKYLLLAAPSYIASKGKPRTPADLTHHACLSFTGYSSYPDWQLSKGGKRKTVRPSGPLISDNSEALVSAAVEGQGVVLAPDWLAGPALKGGKLQEVLPGWSGRSDGGVYAVLPPGRPVPGKVRAFVDDVASAFKRGWRTT